MIGLIAGFIKSVVLPFFSRDLDLDESELEDELPLELEPLELLREDALELLELDPALPLRLLRGDPAPLLPDLVPRSRPRSSSLLSPLLSDLDLDLKGYFIIFVHTRISLLSPPLIWPNQILEQHLYSTFFGLFHSFQHYDLFHVGSNLGGLDSLLYWNCVLLPFGWLQKF